MSSLVFRSAVLVISSYGSDEPTAQVLEAARHTPDVRYYVTGNPNRLPREVRNVAPENVNFTGYLPDAKYDDLLLHADVAMALSTRNNILTQACHEAIGAGVPLVTSDAPVAREYLAGGTVFAKNDASPRSVLGVKNSRETTGPAPECPA